MLNRLLILTMFLTSCKKKEVAVTPHEPKVLGYVNFNWYGKTTSTVNIQFNNETQSLSSPKGSIGFAAEYGKYTYTASISNTNTVTKVDTVTISKTVRVIALY